MRVVSYGVLVFWCKIILHGDGVCVLVAGQPFTGGGGGASNLVQQQPEEQYVTSVTINTGFFLLFFNVTLCHH